jgi:hypothetical protein
MGGVFYTAYFFYFSRSVVVTGSQTALVGEGTTAKGRSRRDAGIGALRATSLSYLSIHLSAHRSHPSQSLSQYVSCRGWGWKESVCVPVFTSMCAAWTDPRVLCVECDCIRGSRRTSHHRHSLVFVASIGLDFRGPKPLGSIR